MDKNDPRVDGEYNTHSLLNIIGMHLLICCLRINSTLLVGSAMKKNSVTDSAGLRLSV